VIQPDGDAALRSLFAECVACALDCARITRRQERGVPPRGFALGPGRLSDKVLMVVFGEPASISVRLDATDDGKNQFERQRYQRALRDGGSPQLAAEQEAMTLEYFASGHSPFHKRTMGLLRDIFGSSERAAKSTYMTHLTKCEKEEPPPPTKEWQIPAATRSTCFDLYLKRELELVRPKAILAFGNAGEYTHLLGEERTLALDHPSRRQAGPRWLYGSQRERTIATVQGLLARAAG